MPGIAKQYDQYSQNENFFYKSIPFYWLDLTDFGKTIVYDAKTKKQLYRLENYIPTGSFISNDGKTIFSLIHWIGQSEPEKENVLDVFINGKKVKTYYIGSFMPERLTITYTTSHAFWYKHIFMNNDTLFIHTLDEQVIILDGKSGQLLNVFDEEFITQRFDMEQLPAAKRIEYDIKYPERSDTLYLRRGISFPEALALYLNRTMVDDYEKATTSTLVGIIIDKSGNADIYFSDTGEKERGTYTEKKENKLLDDKIRNWIRKQKFKANLPPANAEKWVFEQYIYFK